MEGNQTAVSKACEEVFTAPELFSMILFSCPPKALHTLRAVNSSWQQTISCSPNMQRLLFKRPIDGSLGDNPEWCHAWNTSERETTSPSNTESGTSPQCSIQYCLHPLFARHVVPPFSEARQGDAENLDIYRSLDTLSIEIPTQLVSSHYGANVPAGWATDLISQPPVTNAILTFWKKVPPSPGPGPGIGEPEYTRLRCGVRMPMGPHSNGITLGDISWAISDIAEECSEDELDYMVGTICLRFP